MSIEKLPGIILGRVTSQGFHIDAMRTLLQATENAGGHILNPWAANYNEYQKKVTSRGYVGLRDEMRGFISQAWFAIGEGSFQDIDLGNQLEKVLNSRSITTGIFRHVDSLHRSLALDGYQNPNFKLITYDDPKELIEEVQKFIHSIKNDQSPIMHHHLSTDIPTLVR